MEMGLLIQMIAIITTIIIQIITMGLITIINHHNVLIMVVNNGY